MGLFPKFLFLISVSLSQFYVTLCVCVSVSEFPSSDKYMTYIGYGAYPSLEDCCQAPFFHKRSHSEIPNELKVCRDIIQFSKEVNKTVLRNLWKFLLDQLTLKF